MSGARLTAFERGGVRKDGTILYGPEHMEDIKARAEVKCAEIDALPPDVRQVVYEFGWNAVKELMKLGVRRAGQLRHIINACRGGA